MSTAPTATGDVPADDHRALNSLRRTVNDVCGSYLGRCEITLTDDTACAAGPAPDVVPLAAVRVMVKNREKALRDPKMWGMVLAAIDAAMDDAGYVRDDLRCRHRTGAIRDGVCTS